MTSSNEPVITRAVKGLLGINDYSEPERHYTRSEVLNAISTGANLTQEHEYENTDTILTDDTINLAANAAIYLLDHPGARLDEIIIASYSDIELDADDFEDRELGIGESGTSDDLTLPAKGSPAWNAALVRKVLGRLA